jgi:NAD(P)-dependent dehydrogenase (short-subunit alcohol dehydrogenase family)
MAAANGAGSAVVITGASTGIGRACAVRMDSLGYRVFAGVRKTEDGDALRAAASSRLTPVHIDVTDAASIASARETIGQQLGDAGLRGLVNNAGIGVGGPLEFIDIDELRRQFEVNVFGQVAVTQAFLPLIRRAKGRIVNIGSVGGRLASPFIGPYSASKFAMEAITDALRFELREWGIDVAIVEPGSIATPIWDKSRDTADDIERNMTAEARTLYGGMIGAIRAFLDDTAKRAIPPERVADAVQHALTAKRPKTRYLVGTDARLQAALATVAPDRIVDRVIARQLKIGKSAPRAEGVDKEPELTAKR